MPNTYFTNPESFVQGDIIRPTDVDAELNALETAFDSVQSDVKRAITVPAGETLEILEDAATRANTIMSFDGAGAPSVSITLAAFNADIAAVAADLVLTNADVVLTGIDVGLTNADVVSAEAAKVAAEAALDVFDDIWLGAKGVEPTLDNDSNALVAGAIYYNTVTDRVNIYNGSVWSPIQDGIAAIVGDTSPALGGNLDLNGFDIAAKFPAPVLTGTSVTAVKGNYYIATVGGITVTLPSSPSAGDYLAIKDGTGAAATTTFTVARNGSNIASSATDLTFDKNFADIVMTYVDGTIGWSV